MSGFWCKVLWGSQDDANGSLLLRMTDNLREPKIDQLDLLEEGTIAAGLLRKEDVLRLHIPMNDSSAMDGVQRTGDLPNNLLGAIER